MKYQRPPELHAPYPDNCEVCGATLTFGSVMEIVVINAESEGELDFAQAEAFCKPCGKLLMDEAITEARKRGLNVAHMHLTPETVKNARDRGKMH